MEDKIDSSMIGPAEASLFRSSDQIEDDVLELLRLNPATKGRGIQVSVRDGLVTLNGSIDSEEGWDAATDIAQEVLGVTGVLNNLEIEE